MFEKLSALSSDPILELIELYKNDSRKDKIDVGVGVFKTQDGQTPVMKAVKIAEQILHDKQSTKSYVGIAGDIQFDSSIANLVFSDSVDKSRICSIQAPGGSGALRICADTLYKHMPEKTIWVSDPTWGNHSPIFEASGFNVKKYPYFNHQTKMVDEEKMLEALSKMGKNDIVLLHGCCHNPTGSDISKPGWDKITNLINEKGFLPFIDLAYQGFGKGLDSDLYGTRKIAANVLDLIVTSSCSKNFGLYRDRVGCAMILTKDKKTADITKSHLCASARVSYSMPPDHGAAIVSIIMQSNELTKIWQEELTSMRSRILDIRSKLSIKMAEITNTNDWGFINEHKGMFSLLSLNKEQTESLINEHSIYIVNGGRINIAGLRNDNQINRFAKCLAEVTK